MSVQYLRSAIKPASKTIREDGKGMDIQYFNRLWSERKSAEASGKTFWDNRAAEFNKLKFVKAAPMSALRKLSTIC